ncbi:DNA gyrase inhibitor YacG [Bythopirellula polymerisocia]|uniref:Zinc-binding protein n=1 Tax=Bythopirellula polymerisocia TaxID=2528003 RepID=A0A5C6CKX9_9BACT|nr:DNA gyrase inhibitor YacG [Bythopirellula polymerisocia]TWU25523.1 zinc-binding protein [Bythopirellula polymerisocia]
MHCPICNSQFEQHETVAMPFCSDRCRQIDIGRWLEEGYSLPRIADPEDDEEPDDDTLRN